MDFDNLLCSICASTPASAFCSCGGRRETFLCEAHLASHYSKNQGQVHVVVPIAAFGQHTTPGYYTRLQTRAAQIPLGREALLQNLHTIDTCLEEFKASVEGLITALMDYSRTTVDKLMRVKTELERDILAAIEEVQRTMHMDDPVLQCKYARELRDFQQEQTNFKLFQYKIDVNQFSASFSRILQFAQSIDSGESKVLPGICGNSLRLYDLKGGPTKEATLPVTFRTGTVYCVHEDQTVLCMGGQPATAQVYSLDLMDFRIVQMQSMQVARAWPGVLKHGIFVYVFGGYSGSAALTSCEKYSSTEKVWANLPSMQNPRDTFSPCLFEDQVYLAGVDQKHRVIEVFDLATEQFRLLPTPLPAIDGNSVSFIVDGELLIITHNNQMGRWRISSTETRFEVSTVRNDGGKALSSCPPVRLGRVLYWVRSNTGDLNSFNLDTNTISKV